MSLYVTVRDNETGDTDSAEVEDGDYLLICAEPCRLHYVAKHDGERTHVLTVKNRKVAAA